MQGQAKAINERGAVIGWLGRGRPFLWDNGTLTYLDEIPELVATGLTFLQVTGINDRGWITGYGLKIVNGASMNVAYVLVPK